LAIALLVAAALGAQPARAGTYVMRNCDVPGHPSASLGPWWLAQIPPDMKMVDECVNGGGLSFAFAGPRRMTANFGPLLALSRPKTGPQSNIRFVSLRLSYAARLAGAGPAINLVTHEYKSDGGFFTGAPLGPPGAEDLIFEHTFGAALTDHYMVGVSCSPGNPYGPECFPAHNVPLSIRGMEVTLDEDVEPTVLRLGGTLLSGGPQTGVRTLTYSAVDPESGLQKMEVLLGGQAVAARDLTQGCRFDDLTVCPSADVGTLQVNTREVPNGSHRVTLRVRDAAGNQRSVQADPAEVANPGAGSPGEAARLTARFKGSSRATLTVPYGRRVFLNGRLMSASRRGLGRARVDILERHARSGAREHARGSIRTRPDGSFSYALHRFGPSRAVRLAYRPRPAVETSRTLRLRVRAASSLEASLNGTVVRFAGQVLSRPLPKGGKRVLLQGKAPGYTWATFASVRTAPSGRFSGRYRLPVRRPGVKLQIRVVVPTEKSYPYAGYSGKPITLRVR